MLSMESPLERPLERRTAARTAIVWEAVRPLLDRRAGQQILDIGGGTGGFAVRMAAEGHQVTVVDPSPDALAALARRADEQGVADRITGLQGDLADLAGLVPAGAADLVLCHGVLGLVPDPVEALGRLAATMHPDTGVLSLLVGQRHAAVLARAMAGHFGQAKDLLTSQPSGTAAERRFSAEELLDLVAAAGLQASGMQAVRVFSDLVPSSLLDLEPGAGAALLELERAVAERPEYLTLAAQVHVLLHA